MNLKITNGLLLLYRGGEFITKRDELYIKDGKIYSVGGVHSDEEYDEFDASGMLIAPGLINMHTHAYMTSMRNYADDVPFGTWLFERVTPVENNMSGEFAYYSSMLAIMEMLRSGSTCFVDMHMFEGASARAATDAGMRAFIGRGLVGEELFCDGLSRFNQALAEQEKYESELIKFVISPHAVYTCSPKLLRQLASEADERGMLKQIHLAESDFEHNECMKKYGMTPTELLCDCGFIDNAILAHCVKVGERDIEIIREHGATVVTNPASNAKLANGVAPICKMLSEGVNVSIGTDSAASNNSLNMFREMNLLSILHKAVNEDSVAIPSQWVLKMATVNAARALGISDRIGGIAAGMDADLCFIDLNSPSLFPNNNIVSSLCYSAMGSEVSSVMVRGKFLMRRGELTTIDRERVYFEINRMKDKYLK